MRNYLSQVSTCFVYNSDKTIYNSNGIHPELEKCPDQSSSPVVRDISNNRDVPGAGYSLSFKHDIH